jgi:AraC-like DNA-binding protein
MAQRTLSADRAVSPTLSEGVQSSRFLERQVSPAQQVSTANVKHDERFKYWSEYVSVHSKALIMPSTPLHDYRIRAKLRERDDITIQKAVSDPIGFLRTPQHAARQRSDRVRISYCAKVDGGIESGGRSARISDGAVYFRDYRGTGSFWSHGLFEETWLFVPREWFAEGGKIMQEFDGATFQSDHFLAKMMAQKIETVATHAGDARGSAFGQAVRALRTGIEDVFAARASDSHREKLVMKAERLRRIKAYMSRHADDLDLTPDRIADALGMARSSLYRLLQDEGLQINAHVAQYRLNAIARSLRDPAWAGRPIGEIAGLWGHIDQAYFARAFKKQFGMTPSDYRSQGQVDLIRAYL